jgi:hypothetical protein
LPDPISPDLPALRMLAQTAGVAPSHVAAGFTDPEHLFAHITLEELARLTKACFEFVALSERLVAAATIAEAAVAKALPKEN